MIVFSFIVLTVFLVISNKDMEIVEIQSPPLFVFKNPFLDHIQKIKTEFVLQKVLSETSIYGNGKFLLSSLGKVREVKYYFDTTKSDYYFVEFSKRYWWGSKKFSYLSFRGNEFYYVPHVVLSETDEKNFGKALLRALTGDSVSISSEDVKSKIKMLILKKYGVVIK
ncbi:hypothetical protein [Thermosipho atlanticus]|uniref:hypothetical protein n=1 Tax=Thermosipho atlanticus TaxID=238991 RepID=UPI0009FEB062|nr:hypothetical protein [Thermosipho atlanticus]